jgi:transcriptional regulator with XRE-family HTH domain
MDMAPRRTLDPTTSAAALYGYKLREHRDRKGWTQNALADRVDCCTELISKIECAERTASPQMSVKFDKTFGTDKLFQDLQPLAAREILPDWFRPFPKYEAEATVLRIFELTLVNGLLQTEEYARELMRTQHPANKLEELIAARLERQKILERETPRM